MLPQTLLPNERGIAVYSKGIFQGYENVVTLTPAQLADETESNALTRVETLIDQITNLADAKVFLKRLCGRLLKKGLLP